MARNNDPKGLEKALAAARSESGRAGAALVEAAVLHDVVAAVRENAQHGNKAAQQQLQQLRDRGINA